MRKFVDSPSDIPYGDYCQGISDMDSRMEDIKYEYNGMAENGSQHRYPYKDEHGRRLSTTSTCSTASSSSVATPISIQVCHQQHMYISTAYPVYVSKDTTTVHTQSFVGYNAAKTCTNSFNNRVLSPPASSQWVHYM